MSYDICLQAGDTAVKVEEHAEGGTYAIGGTDEACLNVTYNYGEHFPFRELHNVPAILSVDLLREKVDELGVERDTDYWNPTPGNVGYTLSILLRWAEQHPQATWQVYD